MAEHKNILEILHNILKNHKKKEITFGEIMSLLEDQGLMLLIAIIAFPMAIPIPTPPGFTTLFGVPLCILTFQIFRKDNKVWLPKFISEKKIKTETFVNFANKAEPFFNKIAKYLKPRYEVVMNDTFEKIMAVIAFLCSVSVALPILFGNAIPCAAVLIMALGMLYRDGLVVIIGMITGIVGIIISTTVVVLFFWLGKMAFMKLFSDYL